MIVHVGLGKTGTTSLQKVVFPLLVEEGVLESYNPPHIMEALRRYVVTGEGGEELKEKLLKLPKNTLISFESLISWNPEFWEKSASKNAFIFPDYSTILITLRDVESYLASIYTQMLHQGCIMKPENFILSDSDYQFVSPMARPSLCEVFKVDDLDYEKLVELYKDRFSRVVIVPVSALSGLGFLKYLFSLSDKSLSHLRERLSKSKRENVSYSKRAVRLTLLREKILSRLGLRTRSSHDQFLEAFSIRFERSRLSGRVMKRGLLAKFLIKLRYRMSWRYLMQQVVDRVFRYEKYHLPNDIPKGHRLKVNKEFYKRLEEKECGYLVVESQH